MFRGGEGEDQLNLCSTVPDLWSDLLGDNRIWITDEKRCRRCAYARYCVPRYGSPKSIEIYFAGHDYVSIVLALLNQLLHLFPKPSRLHHLSRSIAALALSIPAWLRRRLLLPL